MLNEVRLPADVEVTVVYDSAFDANAIHRVCRRRDYFEVFPVDPNRNLAQGTEPDAGELPGRRVVHWTRSWARDEFRQHELPWANETHGLMRRRHRDSLRPGKTSRRYVAAARHANVSRLGRCVIVASYKENPHVAVGPNQPADWRSCHTGPVRYQGHRWPVPRRWQAKVLARTDEAATARQVVEWYEIRWQIERFFRELKSRLQLGCYPLKSFAAVERYLDLLLTGLLLLEAERLRDLEAAPPPDPRGGEPWLQGRTTDRLRSLEATYQEWNGEVIGRRMRTAGGRRRLLRELRQIPCHVPRDGKEEEGPRRVEKGWCGSD